ncbi:MAG: hypothetical protein Q4D95_01510 [Peptoniphilus sp.]|nr:hypothetical protein [Peptoniphilus sp.]
MKKILLLTMLFTCILSSSVFAQTQAVPSEQKVVFDEAEVDIKGYNIDGNNYYRLRDLAAVLTGSEINFNVEYDEIYNYIDITRQSKYDKQPDDLKFSDQEIKSMAESYQRTFVDGDKVIFSGYLINENNYYKLRDLGKVLGFPVSFDEDTNSVIIENKKIEPVDLINREDTTLISLAADTAKNHRIMDAKELKEVLLKDYLQNMKSVVMLTQDQKQLSMVDARYNSKTNKIELIPEIKYRAKLTISPVIKIEQGDRFQIISVDSHRIDFNEFGKYIDNSKDFKTTLGFHIGEVADENFRGLSVVEFKY